jgi:hypothetical protein
MGDFRSPGLLIDGPIPPNDWPAFDTDTPITGMTGNLTIMNCTGSWSR